jgi:hypothetical protein
MPKEMTDEDIEEFKKAWKESTIRADQAGSSSFPFGMNDCVAELTVETSE